jgi:hypothetical protein
MTVGEEIEKAHKDRRTGQRQKTALVTHARNQSEAHIRHMLKAMQHTTFRAAHRTALAEVGG